MQIRWGWDFLICSSKQQTGFLNSSLRYDDKGTKFMIFRRCRVAKFFLFKFPLNSSLTLVVIDFVQFYFTLRIQ